MLILNLLFVWWIISSLLCQWYQSRLNRIKRMFYWTRPRQNLLRTSSVATSLCKRLYIRPYRVNLSCLCHIDPKFPQPPFRWRILGPPPRSLHRQEPWNYFHFFLGILNDGHQNRCLPRRRLVVAEQDRSTQADCGCYQASKATTNVTALCRKLHWLEISLCDSLLTLLLRPPPAPVHQTWSDSSLFTESWWFAPC